MRSEWECFSLSLYSTFGGEKSQLILEFRDDVHYRHSIVVWNGSTYLWRITRARGEEEEREKARRTNEHPIWSYRHWFSSGKHALSLVLSCDILSWFWRRSSSTCCFFASSFFHFFFFVVARARVLVFFASSVGWSLLIYTRTHVRPYTHTSSYPSTYRYIHLYLSIKIDVLVVVVAKDFCFKSGSLVESCKWRVDFDDDESRSTFTGSIIYASDRSSTLLSISSHTRSIRLHQSQSTHRRSTAVGNECPATSLFRPASQW